MAKVFKVKEIYHLVSSLSIGAFLTFYVVFAPLDYIPTKPPLSSSMFISREKNIDAIVPLNIKYFIESLQISNEQGTLNVVMPQCQLLEA